VQHLFLSMKTEGQARYCHRDTSIPLKIEVC